MSYEKFGKYILLEKLAMGGMAEVYLAKAPSAGGISKFVAIKRILPQFSDSQEFIDMFKDEAKIAINLNHSNVVSIFEFGVESGQFFLVLDYVEGRNLRQILNKIKKGNLNLSTEQILYVVKEVAAGLDNAHRCLDGATGRPLNIIHRDMSPQNIMVSFEGEVKVIDFGIAKAESQLESTRAGTLKGKFGYMSPEQVDGKSVDLRTDIFSLGTVLWELLANDRLFAANNEMNTLRKVRDCQIPSLRKIDPNVSQELDAIVNKSLSRDRNLRYQTAAALHKDLNRFLNRHYPDFSPQDFSVFIKNLYANEILETRKSLIEYSRVQFDGDVTDKTEITATITETGPHSRSVPAAPANAEKTHQTSSSSFVPPANVDFQNLKIDKREILKKTIDIENSQVKAVDMESSQAFEPQHFSMTKSGVTNASHSQVRSQTSFTRTNFKQKPQNNWLKNAVLVTLFLGGLYYLFAPQISEFEDAEAEIEEIASDEIESEEATFTFLVKSTPSKAKIYIGDEDTGVQTPGMIRVPQNKRFLLQLRKDDHITYRKPLRVVREGQMKVITLQKELIGYVDINVGPSTGYVFVNGEKLHQTPPIKGYAVPAGTRISIKAVNPFSHTEDEKIVVVDRDQTKTVNLNLKRKKTNLRLPGNHRN